MLRTSFLPRLACTALLVVTISPAGSGAAVITVDLDCRLAEAITCANTDTAGLNCAAGSGADLIRLTRTDQTTEPFVPGGVNAYPDIVSDITIDGQGFTIQRSDPFDDEDYRLFKVASTGKLTLENVTLLSGYGVGGGGAIYNNGEVHLKDCRVAGNISLSGGGAIENKFKLWVDNCEFELNESTSGSVGAGGAISTGDGCRLDFCFVVVTNSVFDRNGSGSKGGAIYNGEDGYLSVIFTTFDSNTAAQAGAAVYNRNGYFGASRSLFWRNTVTGTSQSNAGAGIYNWGGAVDVNNATFSDNQAAGPGALYTYEGIGATGTTTIKQSTFYGSTATNLFTEASTIGASNNATTQIQGSIVTAGVGGPDCDAEVTSLGNNFGCGSGGVTGIESFITWSGGPTLTYRLSGSSNAIDAGGSCALAQDQRGMARDDPCEAGAYEYGLCADWGLTGDITGETTEEACEYLFARNWIYVPDGDATFRAGKAVILDNNFRVEAGARLTVEIDPTLLP